MNMYNEGYILACFGDIIYYKLTDRIIANIRKYDDTRSICILTDRVDYFDENYKTEHKLIIKHFDYNNHILDKVDMNNNWNKYGLIPKLFHSYYTPFQHTMFLDVDMIFHKDFTFFWENYHKREKKLLYAGISDANNKSPSNWHWNTIDEVIAHSNIIIPEFFGVLVIYDSSLKIYMDQYLELILNNIGNWRIKSFFRGGIPEEIIYAIICGIENISPDREIYDWILDKSYCDAVNKEL